MPSSCSNALLFVLFVSSLCTTLAWTDCGEAFNSEVPRFTQFALFPNPVTVGQTVHARAVVTLSGVIAGAITGGTITMTVTFNGASVLSIPGISLCNSTSSIMCASLATGDNAISFNFLVPEIPVGDYKVTLNIYPIGLSEPGCVSFGVTVVDPSATRTYTSWIEATLAGVAQYSITNYTQRVLGDLIQVGPIGPQPSANTYVWGTFMSVTGSEDLLGSSFTPTGYVWGLNGNMTGMVTSKGMITSQTYTGTFYLGYVSSLLQRTLDTAILTGEFKMTWTYTYDSSAGVTSALTGTINFDSNAVLPLGWSAPVTLGRLGTFSLYANSAGILIVNSTKIYCLTSKPCDYSGAGIAPNSGGVSDRNIVIAVVISVGVPLIVILIVTTVFYVRHRRRHEEEAGIFSAARKPEYGNALVIDDIIQESREHGSTIIPQLERRPGDTESDDDDISGEESQLNRSPKPKRGGRSSRYDSDEERRPEGRSQSRSLGSDESYESD